MDSLLGAAHSELGHSQIAETLFIVLAGAAVFVLSLCLFAFAIAFGSPLRRRQTPCARYSGRSLRRHSC